MTDKIIEAGSTVQLLISQKGVQAIVTIMMVFTAMFMLANGMEVPQWLGIAVAGSVGVYVDLKDK